MTSFIYLTDTHIGADPIGYHRQPAYPEKINRFMIEIQQVIKDQSIDFIIHGGDLVDSCQKNKIIRAADAFNLSIPVYLCLGNHDLDTPDALDVWLRHAPQLFPGSVPDYEMVYDSFVIHMIPNHWEVHKEYYWEEKQDPLLASDQLKRLENTISTYPDKTHIIVTHSTIFGVEPNQTGLEEKIHEAPARFREQFTQLIEKYPNIQLVLSGHSHINTIKIVNNTAFVTGSAFIETPFEYKIVEVKEDFINIETHKLPIENFESFVPRYDEEQAFVQGRKQDRDLFMKL